MTGSCPCQSGLPYEACCGPYHRGARAPSPEALMRARYSAYALNETAFLKASWHTDTCPPDPRPDGDIRWCNLTIVAHEHGPAEGAVRFRATYQDSAGFAVLDEDSRFVLEAGQWLYLHGTTDVSRLRPGRNDACPCGSGRKFKKCCPS
ncbi:MAG: zinc chelation protein SecC [Xanthomonadales bacterium]|nr:zinc chelation protein SecC [Xanthomonadales bacterium]